MSVILDVKGNAARGQNGVDLGDVKIRKWRAAGERKCNGEVFCQGLSSAIIDSANDGPGVGRGVSILGDGHRPEALGILLARHGQFCMMNFCPFCGNRMKLAENQL